MAKEITEGNNTSFKNKNPQSLDTGQLEYTANSMLIYGTICLGLLTLSVTYIYLLIQKIKN
jgi:hypothetical protein